TALGKVTWILAIGFIATSITLTIIAAQNASGSSVLDRLGDQPAAVEEVEDAPASDTLLPPGGDDADAPLVPRAD
ncbi:MAG: preprotein translocase subunit SecG, partial [Rhodobacteraceae bacterium]|nr:preprotein translocase subunit SecG [Paracoccaceae bacterium]